MLDINYTLESNQDLACIVLMAWTFLEGQTGTPAGVAGPLRSK